MSNRSYKRSGGKFSSFASALIGAIVGGFVVYFLLSGAKDNSKTNVDKNIDNQPKKRSQSNYWYQGKWVYGVSCG